jgi:hypothetical protein
VADCVIAKTGAFKLASTSQTSAISRPYEKNAKPVFMFEVDCATGMALPSAPILLLQE